MPLRIISILFFNICVFFILHFLFCIHNFIYLLSETFISSQYREIVTQQRKRRKAQNVYILWCFDSFICVWVQICPHLLKFKATVNEWYFAYYCFGQSCCFILRVCIIHTYTWHRVENRFRHITETVRLALKFMI